MLFNAFVLALREIRRNVLRSSLTALGIIIGVASVIIMVTLGNGATAQVRADIASMGSNLLTVMPGQRVGPGGASSSAKPSSPCSWRPLRPAGCNVAKMCGGRTAGRQTRRRGLRAEAVGPPYSPRRR